MKTYITTLIVLSLFVLACIIIGCQREYFISETNHVDYVEIYTKDNKYLVIENVDKIQRWYKTGVLEEDEDFWIIIFEDPDRIAHLKYYWKDIYKFKIILEK